MNPKQSAYNPVPIIPRIPANESYRLSSERIYCLIQGTHRSREPLIVRGITARCAGGSTTPSGRGFDGTRPERDGESRRSIMDQAIERSPLSKVHYRPIEAAIRWTRLWKHERQILDVLQNRNLPDPGEFPQWSSLRLNAERIFDALRNGELPYGIDGVPAPPDAPIDHPNLTIRHVHLKSWMKRYYPEQRPKFLFSTLERRVHPGITIDSVRALNYECNSLKSIVAERDNEISALRIELRALLKSMETHPRHGQSGDTLSNRAEMVYLHIIGGQLDLLVTKEPSGKTRFRTQEEVIAALTDRYGKRLGITKSTLEAKFALANRMLSDRS